MNEIKELNKWRDIPCSQIGRLKYCQDVRSFHLICRFNTIAIKIPASYFVDIDKLEKFIWKGKRLRIANTILKEKNKIRGLALPDFKTYYKAIVVKRVWH